MTSRVLSSSRTLAAGVVAVALSLVAVLAAQAPGGAIPMDADDIAGVVTGPDGPEAGVWVIAETRDLPTRFVRIVVTDDAGRYLLPDLPEATYDVWVRGYGLVDSEKVRAEPGDALDLAAVAAPDAMAAAEYYPAQDWFALLEVPAPDEFPARGPTGTASRPTSRARASGSARWSTPTAAPAATRWGTRPRGRFPRPSATSTRTSRPGTAACSPGRPAPPWTRGSRWSGATAPWRCTPTGPTASRPASTPPTRRPARGAWSATPSSRCGTGRIPRRTCTT